jgi:nucleoside-triphosphatase THEP1
MQMGEKKKKMKEQNNPIELTIIEDDTELVVDKVQDRGEELLYVTESQREELMNTIMEVKNVMEILQLTVTQQRSAV